MGFFDRFRRHTRPAEDGDREEVAPAPPAEAGQQRGAEQRGTDQRSAEQRRTPGPDGPSAATTQPDPAGALGFGRDPVPDPESEESLEELARSVEWARLQAFCLFTTQREPYEQLGPGLIRTAVLEGLDPERAESVIRGAWDRLVRLAERKADEDMSAPLRRAFAALESEGLLAREYVGISTGDGHSEMTEIATRMRPPVEEYVFFHAQDLERLADGPGPLMLRFGRASYESKTADGKYEEDAAVARRVIAALEREGLRPSWGGDGRESICIHDMAWYPMPGR